jgi:hypothetical protein
LASGSISTDTIYEGIGLRWLDGCQLVRLILANGQFSTSVGVNLDVLDATGPIDNFNPLDVVASWEHQALLLSLLSAKQLSITGLEPISGLHADDAGSIKIQVHLCNITCP